MSSFLGQASRRGKRRDRDGTRTGQDDERDDAAEETAAEEPEETAPTDEDAASDEEKAATDETDGSEDAAEPEESAEAESGSAKPGMWAERSPTPFLALMIGAVIVAGGACGVLKYQHSQAQAIKSAREQGLAAGQSDAKDLLSYNFRTLDYDLKKARAEMTPAMAKSYDAYWKIFRPSVEKSQTQALTQVQVAGVTQATSDHVEVLLFVKMISVNAAHKEPQVDTSWPRLQMTKVGKRWLIDGPKMTTPPPASSVPSQASTASNAPKTKQ